MIAAEDRAASDVKEENYCFHFTEEETVPEIRNGLSGVT